MEDRSNIIEPLIEKAEECVKTGYKLFKLKTLDKTVEISSSLISSGAFFFIFTTALFLLNIGASIWLGDLLGKLYYGFFCVAGFYAITGSVLYFFMSKWIKKCISNSLISQIFN